MVNHSSATAQEETPHVLETSRTNTIVNALKQRMLGTLNDESLDAQSRAILRHALENDDPWLARLVRPAGAGESVANTFDFSQTPEPNEHDSRKRIEALAEIICAAGEDASAALLVLMAALQNSTDPTALANTVKHFAFTRCGELNFRGMVDTQVALIGDELLCG